MPAASSYRRELDAVTELRKLGACRVRVGVVLAEFPGAVTEQPSAASPEDAKDAALKLAKAMLYGASE